MRLFFATDVHGSDTCWVKFLRAAENLKVDALVLGGDIVGKMIVPIATEDGRRYTYSLHNRTRTVQASDLDRTCKEVSRSGFYPYVCSAVQLDDLRSGEAQIDQLFQQLSCDRLQKWLDMASELLPASVRLLVSPGNDDPLYIDPILEGHSRNEYPEGVSIQLGEYEMITCGWVNPTPWHTEREESEEQLAERLERLFNLTTGTDRVIANLHVPPFDSGIDRAPALDANMRPVGTFSGVKMKGAGSTAVRSAIERHAPILALHGHIHESPGQVRLGKTLCINPGSEYGEGILRGVLVVLDGSKVQVHILQK